MDQVHDLTQRALAYAGGIGLAAEGGPAQLRRRFVARLAGTAGPDTLTAARARCLHGAEWDSSGVSVLAAELLGEAAQAWSRQPV